MSVPSDLQDQDFLHHTSNYINAADLAFWEDPEQIGEFGGPESDENRADDPYRHTLVSRGRSFQDGLLNILAQLRTRTGQQYPEDIIANLMEEAQKQDSLRESRAPEVYVGLITGIYH